MHHVGPEGGALPLHCTAQGETWSDEAGFSLHKVTAMVEISFLNLHSYMVQ